MCRTSDSDIVMLIYVVGHNTVDRNRRAAIPGLFPSVRDPPLQRGDTFAGQAQQSLGRRYSTVGMFGSLVRGMRGWGMRGAYGGCTLIYRYDDRAAIIVITPGSPDNFDLEFPFSAAFKCFDRMASAEHLHDAGVADPNQWALACATTGKGYASMNHRQEEDPETVTSFSSQRAWHYAPRLSSWRATCSPYKQTDGVRWTQIRVRRWTRPRAPPQQQHARAGGDHSAERHARTNGAHVMNTVGHAQHTQSLGSAGARGAEPRIFFASPASPHKSFPWPCTTAPPPPIPQPNTHSHYSWVEQHIGSWPTGSCLSAKGTRHKSSSSSGCPTNLNAGASSCGMDVARPRGDRLDRQAGQVGVGGPRHQFPKFGNFLASVVLFWKKRCKNTLGVGCMVFDGLCVSGGGPTFRLFLLGLCLRKKFSCGNSALVLAEKCYCISSGMEAEARSSNNNNYINNNNNPKPDEWERDHYGTPFAGDSFTGNVGPDPPTTRAWAEHWQLGTKAPHRSSLSSSRTSADRAQRLSISLSSPIAGGFIQNRQTRWAAERPACNTTGVIGPCFSTSRTSRVHWSA
ncbi:hypothetical protein EDB89DRAFT_2238943 [Lactarius sanguifluus]|nr:hypothetical protein EDB89DRAFT_2238943 [Lactarius sanguifluus]